MDVEPNDAPKTQQPTNPAPTGAAAADLEERQLLPIMPMRRVIVARRTILPGFGLGFGGLGFGGLGFGGLGLGGLGLGGLGFGGIGGFGGLGGLGLGGLGLGGLGFGGLGGFLDEDASTVNNDEDEDETGEGKRIGVKLTLADEDEDEDHGAGSEEWSRSCRHCWYVKTRPVCGRNRITYRNRCEARCKGVPVRQRGYCFHRYVEDEDTGIVTSKTKKTDRAIAKEDLDGQVIPVMIAGDQVKAMREDGSWITLTPDLIDTYLDNKLAKMVRVPDRVWKGIVKTIKENLDDKKITRKKAEV